MNSFSVGCLALRRELERIRLDPFAAQWLRGQTNNFRTAL
jgi:hypothetical protein